MHTRIMSSLQLASVGEHSPWRTRSRDGDSSPPTTTARNDLLPDDFTTWQDRDMILPPSPPPQSTELAPQVPIPMQTTETPTTDMRLASLKAIFPDFDDAVILSVLESTGDDHDRAVDALLVMNDPSFVPSAQPPPRSPRSWNLFRGSVPSSDAQRLSQEALDEQLARRLALEEQEAADPDGGMGYIMYQPYQTRQGGRGGWRGRPRTQSHPQAQQTGRDTMTDLQEGFSRIAESGKKTFSSLISKVRAKMQDFESGSSQSPPPAVGEPTPPARSLSYPPHASAPGQPQGAGRTAFPASSPSPLPHSGVLRPAVTTSTSPSVRPSYYDPNTRGYDVYGDDEATIAGEVSPMALAPARSLEPTEYTFATTRSSDDPAPPPFQDREEVQGQTQGPSPPALVSPPPSSSPSPPSLPFQPSALGPGALPASTASAGAGAGARGATRASVDYSKLGLLPKRPISLVRPQSPPTAGAGVGDAGSGTTAGAAGVVHSAPRLATVHSESQSTATTTSSENDYRGGFESEFVENPFEERT